MYSIFNNFIYCLIFSSIICIPIEIILFYSIYKHKKNYFDIIQITAYFIIIFTFLTSFNMSRLYIENCPGYCVYYGNTAFYNCCKN